MLETLITSKTRVKILIKFFLNSKSTSYLRRLENEFGESSNAIRLELNKFEIAGLLISKQEGNKKVFQANTTHPLFNDIHSILLKYVGFDKLIEKVITKLGKVSMAFITGELAKGNNCDIIDLVLVGDKIDKSYLLTLIGKVEKIISKKIKFLTFRQDEIQEQLGLYSEQEVFLLWKES